MTHNACLAYPEWLKDKKTNLFNVKEDDELDKEAAVAAAMVPTEELAGNDDE